MKNTDPEPVEVANRVKVFEHIKNEKPYLQFDFKGHLDHSSAIKAIEEWRRYMERSSKKNLIYNCKEMTGFDSSARKIWQATMGEFKQRTGSIWIISSNVFILGAAKTMGVLTGFLIKVAKTTSEIKD